MCVCGWVMAQPKVTVVPDHVQRSRNIRSVFDHIYIIQRVVSKRWRTHEAIRHHVHAEVRPHELQLRLHGGLRRIRVHDEMLPRVPATRQVCGTSRSSEFGPEDLRTRLPQCA